MVIDASSPNVVVHTRPGMGRLALWVLLCLGGGLAIGLFFQPGEWFRALERPTFAPPDWVFGPVWSTLYVLMAIAMWRVERRPDQEAVSVARKYFLGQLAVNFAWTPVFFGMHAISVALGVIVGLWVLLSATILFFHSLDRPAAWMLLPYWAWVAFATALNAVYFYLN